MKKLLWMVLAIVGLQVQAKEGCVPCGNKSEYESVYLAQIAKNTVQTTQPRASKTPCEPCVNYVAWTMLRDQTAQLNPTTQQQDQQFLDASYKKLFECNDKPLLTLEQFTDKCEPTSSGIYALAKEKLEDVRKQSSFWSLHNLQHFLAVKRVQQAIKAAKKQADGMPAAAEQINKTLDAIQAEQAAKTKVEPAVAK